jgi:hypothetical protein
LKNRIPTIARTPTRTPTDPAAIEKKRISVAEEKPTAAVNPPKIPRPIWPGIDYSLSNEILIEPPASCANS